MTVTGKIKVDSIASLGSGCHFFVNNLAGKELASYPNNTNGWINLSLKVTYSDARLIFGGWYAGGQMKFADLVIKKAMAPCSTPLPTTRCSARVLLISF